MLIIGKCIAGNNRLGDGRTLADKYPKKYDNVLADYINLVIAQTYYNQSLDKAAVIKKELEEL